MNKQVNNNIPQLIRFLILVIYLIILVAVNWLAFKTPIPLTNEKGLWFFSGAIALLLGSLLFNPFFTSPTDAISYLISALVGIHAYPLISMEKVYLIPRIAILIICYSLLFICVIQIIFKESKKNILLNISEISRVIANSLGNPRFVFTLVIIYSIWEYHTKSTIEVFWISIAGLIIITRPLENLYHMVNTIIEKWHPEINSGIIGSVWAYQTPNIILIKQEISQSLKFGSIILISEKNSVKKIGVALGYCGRDENLILRVIVIETQTMNSKGIIELFKNIPECKVALLDGELADQIGREVELLKNSQKLIGIVAVESTINNLKVELIQENEIEQGRIIETQVGDKVIQYQILEGITKEEIIQQKSTYGYSKCEASQIGRWDSNENKFIQCNWIPMINTPVFLRGVEDYVVNNNAIGHLPSTGFEVRVKNFDELVTHNTAILGILGVGKSMLAIELVERIITAKIKVICIDPTTQYNFELSKYISQESEAELDNFIISSCDKGKGAISDSPSDGGSIQNFKEALYEDIKHFINDPSRFLRILNPLIFSPTVQDNEPKNYKVGPDWKRSAGLRDLSPVEITRLITECCLEILRKTITDKARVCIVFEEAHSLIPEWNSTTNEGDRTASNGTARAILQGRKYGLGCLLITQRTANVTKTILNQCNTIFAMRTFDDTGKDFLANYLGQEYSSKLPNLKERHAVLFGRASSCENPVLIRLNDREDFKKAFYGKKS